MAAKQHRSSIETAARRAPPGKRAIADEALEPANGQLVEPSEKGMLTQVECAVRGRQRIEFLG
ncbi:hypothetical protein [Burkholderia savannae]|uniref:hypothetical protein n=1 Tax=Burkholderia savannae TaxID=1637837 RepID=UPI0039C9D09B